jgi:hypothetical protein
MSDDLRMLLVPFIGLGELFGRLSSGVILQSMPHISAHAVSTCIFTLAGFLLFMISMVKTVTLLIVLTIIYGYVGGNGIFFILLPIIQLLG